MPDQNHEELTLRELAARSGVPARTIRLYISRGLLPGPLRAGRGAAYSSGHLEKLAGIRRLQGEGLTLREIAQRLEPATGRARLPEPSAWLNFKVADDVVVLVRADASPWRARRIQTALGGFSEALSDEKETDHDGDS